MLCKKKLKVCIIYLVRISKGVYGTSLLTIQDHQPMEFKAPVAIRLLQQTLGSSTDVNGLSGNHQKRMRKASNDVSASFSQMQVPLTKSSFIFNLPLSAQKLLTSGAIHSHLTQYLNENLKTSFSSSSSVTKESYSFGKVEISIQLKDSVPNRKRYLSNGSRKTVEDDNEGTSNLPLSNVTAIMQGEATFLTHDVPSTSIMDDILMKHLGLNSTLLNSFANSDDDAISQIQTYSYSIEKSTPKNTTIQGLNTHEQPQSSSEKRGFSSIPFVFVISAITGALVVGIVVACVLLVYRITNKREVKDASKNDCEISKEDRTGSIAGLSVEESCGRSSAYYYDHRQVSLLSPSMNDDSLCSNRGAPPGASLSAYDDSFTKSLSLYDPRRLEMIVGISQKVAGGQSVSSGSRSKGSHSKK